MQNEFDALIERMTRKAYEAGFSAGRKFQREDIRGSAYVQEGYTPEGYNYEDWRAYGPGATLPGGEIFRAEVNKPRDILPHRVLIPLTHASAARVSYMVYRGYGAGEGYTETPIGARPTLADAQEFCVPGHPDEWVADGEGTWIHGGGNFPGESFRIEEVLG